MEENKIKKWIKEHKKGIILTTTGIGVGMSIIYSVIKRQINTEGTDLWFKFATLDELKKYREKVGIAFMYSGINNLSDYEYSQVERMKFKLDKTIRYIENEIYTVNNPKTSLPRSEHGWYLPSES